MVAHCRLHQLCPQLCQPLPVSPALPVRSQAAPSTLLPSVPCRHRPGAARAELARPQRSLLSQGNSTISAPCLPAVSQGGGKANIGLLFTSFPFREPRPPPPGSICPLLPAGPGSASRSQSRGSSQDITVPSPLLSLRYPSPRSSSARPDASFHQLQVRMQREPRPPAAAPAEGAHHTRLLFLAVIPSPALLRNDGASRQPDGIHRIAARKEQPLDPFVSLSVSLHPCPQGCKSPGDRGWVRSLSSASRPACYPGACNDAP